MTKTIAGLATLCALVLPAAASAGGMYGTYPLNISVTPSGAPGDGNSSHPAISGDNRKTRFVAFQSDATNLVGGDTNGATDIFLWSRPSGGAGLKLGDTGQKVMGSLQRVSVASDGSQANGPSRWPSVDGSIQKGSHCVAFESDATNLVPGDTDNATDVFVRDFRAGKTYLVSRGINTPATQPDISGDCSKVAFVAGGKVLVAGVRSGKVKTIGAGSDPDYALDGRAIAWQAGSKIMLIRDGKKVVVGPGSNPTVTDAERLHNMKTPNWGVSFDTPAKLSSKDHNPGVDTYLRVYGPKGGAKRTDLISYAQSGPHFDGAGDNVNGGITAYGTNRGILSFVHTEGDQSDAYYWNQHTGNADDIAHAAAQNGQPGIAEMVTSARADFYAFTSSFAGDMSLPFSGTLFPGHGSKLPGGIALPDTVGDSFFAGFTSVYFKALPGGEAL